MREHDVVRLKREVEGMVPGTMGTVMIVSPDIPGKILVEFSDPNGEEILLIEVNKEDVDVAFKARP